MAKKRSILEKMRANPAGDWSISDVETLCKQFGLKMCKPNSGSHYMVVSDYVLGGQSVPYCRPIKSIYIKRLISLCDAQTAYKEKKKGEQK